LIRLLAGELDEREVGDVYGHVADCAECRATIAALREARLDPESVLVNSAEWLARQRSPQTERKVPTETMRFRFGFEIVVDPVRNLAVIALESLDALSRAPGLYRGESIRAASAAGDPRPVARSSPPPPRVEVAVHGPGFGSATVVADARRNAVSVILRPGAGESAAARLRGRAPRAVLMSREGSRRHEMPFAAVEGATYLLAEFEDLDESEWILGLTFED